MPRDPRAALAAVPPRKAAPAAALPQEAAPAPRRLHGCAICGYLYGPQEFKALERMLVVLFLVFSPCTASAKSTFNPSTVLTKH
jgi:hypothetical protein